MEIRLAILGGGLVGRIAGAVLGGVILEANDSAISNLEKGLIYLHVGEGMKMLLEQLEMPTNTVPVKGGIVWWKDPVPFSSADTKGAIEAYCLKTRGVPLDSLLPNDRTSIMNFALRGGGMERYSIPASILWERLVEETDSETIYGIKVKGVEGKRLVTDSGELRFHKAINTLPLSILAGYASGLEASSSNTFRFLSYEIMFPEYDFLYLPGANYKATRISFPAKFGMARNSEEVLLETPSNLELAYEDMYNLGYRMPVCIGHTINKMKQLSGNPDLHLDKMRKEGIYSIGRYGRWDDRLTASTAAWEVMRLAGYN
jgi:hypothetical protein